MGKKSLNEEISDFQQDKKKLVPYLLLLGLIGLFLPVLPGIAILFLVFLLIFPRYGEDIISRIRETFKMYFE